MVQRYAFLLIIPLLAACSVKDANTAAQATTDFIGMSQVDLESCLGVPDAEKTFGKATVLTYKGNSTANSGASLDLPIIGTLNLSGGGYCHTTIRLEDSKVIEVRYTGETDSTFGHNSYCAPIVRSCVEKPEPVQ